MANSYKDIIITPNRANTADPKIEFRGGNTTVNTSITLQTYPISNGMLSFEGAAGQLFSITNDLTGSLFSVNDVSGIPSFEVLANGYVMIAPMGGSVVIGNTVFGNTSTSTTGRLVVTSPTSPQIEAIHPGTGNAYIGVNRATAAAGEVGYMYRTAGTTNWWNYMPTNSGSMNWFSAGSDRMTLSNTGILNVTGDLRVPIMYDRDNAAYYSNPAGISNLLDLVLQGGVASIANTANYYDAALEVREFNFGGAQIDTTSLSPRIGFHWSGRVASQIGMNSSGHIVILNNPGNDYEVLRSGNFYSPIFYDGNDSAYYCNPNGTSYLATIENNGGAKFVIQNGVDGGNTRGLAMWTGTDNNWAIYMSQSGGTRSFNGGAAPTSLLGTTAHHIRFRVANNDNQGFLWENGAESGLMSLSGSSGNLAVKGNFRAGVFYDVADSNYYFDLKDAFNNTYIRSAGGFYVDATGHYFRQTSDSALWATINSDYLSHVSDVRTPIFYDSDNTGYYLDPNSTTNLNDVTAISYRQTASGIPRINLGDPSVTEMGLFDDQFNNKTAFYPPANVICETSTDGTTWSAFSVTDANKKSLVGGDSYSGLSIPYNTPYFRIRFVNDGNYVYLNALYMFFSSQGHSTKVQMYTKNYGSTTWVQYTSSNVLANAWPGHIYLPFSTIAYHPSTYIDEVAIVFIPTWNGSFPSNPIALYKAQIWGGYPAARRNIYSTDSDKNVVFPASVSASTFFDSNNSAYYIDPASTSVLNLLTVSSTNDVQLTLSGGGTSWAGLYWSDPDGADTIYYRGSTSTFAIGGGGSVVSNKKLHINGGTTIGSGLAATSVATNGLLVQTDVRAPLFYDSDNTSFYIDPASSSIVNSFSANTVTIGLPNGGGTTPVKTFSVVTNGQGANHTTYEIGRISRDVANWSTNVLEITVYNIYYRGGMSRWVVTYNQVDAGTVELIAEAGTFPHKLYLGNEVTVAGNVRYRPILIDLPEYTIANIEMKYKYAEVTSISAASQLQFTGTYTTNASATGYASTTTSIIANNSIHWNGIALPASGTSFATPNTIGRSDSNGYTFFHYINSNTGNAENPTVSQIIVTNGSDNYYRKASVAHVAAALGSSMSANNSSLLQGRSWATPFAIGSTVANTGAFTSMSTTQSIADTTATGYGGLRILNPGGAAFSNSTPTVVGAIKIKLPTATFKSNTMMRMTIKIYEYAGSDNGTSRTIEVGGYNYSDAAANWINYFATQSTMGGGDINVRFGNDGTSQCVWIGDTNTSWSYPQIFVTEVQAGYSNFTQAQWGSGWAVSVASAFDTVTQGPIIAAKPVTSQNYNTYAPTKTGGGASGTWSISVTGNAATAGGLSVHTGTNNEANKIVRTDGSGYIQAGYIHSASGNEANNSNPPRVWGVNGGDSYLRTYLTSALSVGSAATLTTARNINGVSFNGSADITIPASDSTKLPLAGGTMTGMITGMSSSATNVNTDGDNGSISIRGSASTVAMMSFHRVSAYAIQMGLGTDNVFRIGGWSASDDAFKMDGSGNLTMLNNVTAYSDIRVKKDIVKIDNALEKVGKLNGYTYTRTDIDSRQMGVIAQEVMEVIPEVVLGSEETNYSVAYGNMVALLIEAVKEQQTQIDDLKQLVKTLINKGTE